MEGRVYLVGAGPGDPRLLTQYAVKRMAVADTVIYDRLIHPNILDLAPSYAERVYVGKEHGKVSVSQDSINSLLVEQAQKGKTVVRLKGGDPFLFGRGGEEASVLRSYHIPFEIIPGLSSSMASLSYAGIPMTHRGLVQGISIVGGFDGHFPYSWQDKHSWVVLMGLEHVNDVVAKALDAGFPPDLPACAIEWGTWGQQRIVRATLVTLPRVVKARAIESPCVLVLGENVGVSEELSWWEKQPWHARRVIVVSAYPVDWSMLEEYREQGAEVLNWSVYLSASVARDSLVHMASDATIFVEEFAVINTVMNEWITIGRDLRDFPNLCIPPSELTQAGRRGFRRVEVASHVERMPRKLYGAGREVYVTFEQFQSLDPSVKKHVRPFTEPAIARRRDALWSFHLSKKFDMAVLVSPSGEKWYRENPIIAEHTMFAKN